MGKINTLYFKMSDKKQNTLNKSNSQQFNGISVKQSFQVFDDNINQCQHEMTEYKKEIEGLRSDLLLVENNIKNKQNDIRKYFDPQIFKLNETLEKFKDDQWKENISYNQQITQLK